MTPAAIIERMSVDGLRLQITAEGNIRVQGEQERVERWLTTLRERKQEIIEEYEERAAIMEFDGGMTRHEAEKTATEDFGSSCSFPRADSFERPPVSSHKILNELKTTKET